MSGIKPGQNGLGSVNLPKLYQYLKCDKLRDPSHHYHKPHAYHFCDSKESAHPVRDGRRDNNDDARAHLKCN